MIKTQHLSFPGYLGSKMLCIFLPRFTEFAEVDRYTIDIITSAKE